MHEDSHEPSVAMARNTEPPAAGSGSPSGITNMNASSSIGSLVLPTSWEHQSRAQTLAEDSDNNQESDHRPQASRHSHEQLVVPCSHKSLLTPGPSSQPNQRKHSLATDLKPWALEICSAALSVITLVAFWPTLSLHAGQPLPQWPLSTSINTLLSVFALVLKINLVFIVASCIGQSQWSWFYGSPATGKPLSDLVRYHNASNSAFGSLRYLIPSGPHFTKFQPLATIGALITIFSLPIEPFVQQLVTHTDCSQSLRALNATLPRTSFLTMGDDIPSILDTQFYPDIMSALYTPVPKFTGFDCASGNCTFPGSYSTLGFCSSCDDITQGLTYSRMCDTRQNNSTIPNDMAVCEAALASSKDGLGSCDQSDILTQITQNLTLSTSDNAVGSSEFSLNYVVSGLFRANESMCDFNFSEYISLGASSRGALEFDCGSKPCIGNTGDLTFLYSNWDHYYLLPNDCNATATAMSWYCNGYGGARCRIGPCIQTYTAYVEAGILADVLVEQSDVETPWAWNTVPMNVPGDYLALMDLSLVGADLEKELLSAGYDIGGTDRWVGFNLTQDPVANSNGSLQKSLFDAGALFAMGSYIYLALISFFWDAVEGTSGGGTGSVLSQLIANETIISAESIAETMENVAKAITLAIRSNGFPGYSNPALGIVNGYAVCVRVNWEWFAFPAILGALTVCLLIFTIVDTVRYDLPVWKSFPLTTLFHGPPGKEWLDETQILGSPDTEISLESLGTQDGMEKLAGKVSVRLIKGDDGGHRLVQLMSNSR